MQATYGELIEHSKAYATLRRDIDGGNVSHAYVLVSPDTEALETLSTLFLRDVLGGDRDAVVRQRLADDSYLDVVRLPREGTKMRVEDVAYLTDTAYMTPTELPHKYYLIAPAEPMSEIVQNKLLKTLEEPPAHARFLLFSGGSDLLPTVLSRARVVQLEAFAPEDLVRELQKKHTDEVGVRLAAACCRGQIGTADRMAGDASLKKQYDLCFELLRYLQRSPEILHYAAILGVYKDNLLPILDFLEVILRDVLTYHAGQPDLLRMKQNSYDLIALSREYSAEAVLRVLPLVTRARRRLASFCNGNSVIDELLFSILEVKAQCRK